MYGILANADASDPNSANLILILGGAIILGIVAVMVSALIYISRARDHRHADVITAMAFFWGLLAAGSLLYAEVSQINWSKEYNTQLMSGYLDPQDTSDAPKLPWLLWIGLAVVYAVMLKWALSQKRAAPPEP
jgi:DMSO reductase anchor subunit